MTTTPLSVADVKRELPMVRMDWNGKRYWARVTGRMCPYACVSPFQVIDRKKLVTTVMGPCFQYAWETVTNAINTGRPLIV